MNQIVQNPIIEELKQARARSPAHHVAPTFWEQGEFVTLSHFVSQGVIECLLEEVERVRPKLRRNYIPTHKKGGSVFLFASSNYAFDFVLLPIADVSRVAQRNRARVPLQRCPDDDPHACALYFYTKPGDHIGWHYDTSYYNGARYTVLLGLVN